MTLQAFRADAIDHLRWRLPEISMLAASMAAWLALAARAGVHMHSAGAAANWRHWMLMVAAMMLPLQVDKIRLTAERSLWSRRHRAALEYLVGYLSVWAALGAPLSLAFTLLHIGHRVDWRLGTAMGLVITAAWLVSPWKRVAARMCHRTAPLSAAGWEADRDCICFGWLSGSTCALNCWPLMLVCWLSSHSFIAMLFSFVLSWIDRHFPPDYARNAAAVVVLALSFGLAGVFFQN
ncbi:MAG TPA: DUF2182 domain-containing protein [Bryobacteraceae bacterium]|nr:DUF2182 domain-containing protein [Bryobacteraceae bacterium]